MIFRAAACHGRAQSDCARAACGCQQTTLRRNGQRGTFGVRRLCGTVPALPGICSAGGSAVHSTYVRWNLFGKFHRIEVGDGGGSGRASVHRCLASISVFFQRPSR